MDGCKPLRGLHLDHQTTVDQQIGSKALAKVYPFIFDGYGLLPLDADP